MPPLILFAAGIVGAVVVGRVLYREAQRINAKLHPQQRADDEPETRTLERDPASGVYRPK